MRGHELLQKIELVDPASVAAADAPVKKGTPRWLRWGAMAACLCLVIGGIWAAGRRSGEPQPGPGSGEGPGTVNGLERITVPALQTGEMGYESLLCYDISEYRDGNPWREDMTLTTLPVYRNGSYDASGAGIPLGLGEEEIRARLEAAAAAWGVEVASTELLTDDGLLTGIPIVTGIEGRTADGGRITAYADGTARLLWIGEAPEEYRLSLNGSTDVQAEEALRSLTERYGGGMDLSQPRYVSYERCNFAGEASRNWDTCFVYDAAGDDAQAILNYSFRRLSFYPGGEEGDGGIHWRDSLLTAEKLGDYPVISLAEATGRLKSGQFQTSAPAEYLPQGGIGEERIGMAELVYRTGPNEEVLLPYYRFYVLLPEAAGDADAAPGLKVYGACYVPAIEEEYLTALPTYDGGFAG